MICPECRAVYRTGFQECHDCQIPLVEALPPDLHHEDQEDSVIVLASGNPVKLQLARSMLEKAGIDYSASGQEAQYLLGAGASLGQLQPTTGPVRISVLAHEVSRATQLLDQIDDAANQEDQKS